MSQTYLGRRWAAGVSGAHEPHVDYPNSGLAGQRVHCGRAKARQYVMVRPESQLPILGGLAWLDADSRKKAGALFVELSDGDQKEVLDELVWLEVSAPDGRPGVVFFGCFRDMVATEFWTGRMGVEDLQYMGNVYVQEWTGCPQEVLDHLGVS